MLVTRGGRGLTANGWQNRIFRGKRNILYRGYDGDYMITYLCQNLELQRVNFPAGKL